MARKVSYYWQHREEILAKRHTPEYRAKRKEYDKLRDKQKKEEQRRKHPQVSRKTALKYYYAHRDEILVRRRAYHKAYQQNPVVKAKNRIRAADQPRRGDVCQKCGSEKDIETHHIDYIIGNFITLCRGCHRALHRKNG